MCCGPFSQHALVARLPLRGSGLNIVWQLNCTRAKRISVILIMSNIQKIVDCECERASPVTVNVFAYHARMSRRAQQFQFQLISMLPCARDANERTTGRIMQVKRSENLASLLRARVSHAIRASAIAKIHKNEIVLVDDRRPLFKLNLQFFRLSCYFRQCCAIIIGIRCRHN